MGLLAKAAAVMLVASDTGGLLRKMMAYIEDYPSAAVTPTDGIEVFPAQNTGAHGLLRRSLLYLQCGKADGSGQNALLIVDYTEKIEGLVKRIESLERDYSFFPTIFDLLFREFSFTTGALFIYNRYSDNFVPWLAKGLDEETRKSISFSLSAWMKISGESPQKPVRIEDVGHFFQNPPPVRLSRPMYMFPFLAETKFNGALLVANLRHHPRSLASLFECFENISWKIGQAITTITRSVGLLDAPARFYYSAGEVVKNLMEANVDTREFYYIMKIPLTPLFGALLEKYRYFNTERFQEAMLFVLNTALFHLGAGVRQQGDCLLVFTRGAEFFSPDLFAHHITELIKDFFAGIIDDMPPFYIIKYVEYPACGSIPREMIAEI